MFLKLSNTIVIIILSCFANMMNIRIFHLLLFILPSPLVKLNVKYFLAIYANFSVFSCFFSYGEKLFVLLLICRSFLYIHHTLTVFFLYFVIFPPKYALCLLDLFRVTFAIKVLFLLSQLCLFSLF